MALFIPVTGPQALPAVGTAREMIALDFKRDLYDLRKPFEMAKDVAAFANASGGTILVGAEEDLARHVLLSYKPITDEAAAAAQREAVSVAVRDRCAPAPLVDPTIIRHSDGGFIVAVNVWPFPAQPIGVRVRADKTAEGWGGDSYVFPARVGVHTHFLRPEQLPMLMVPKLRTAAILLDAIKPKEPVRVVDERGMFPGGNFCYFTAVDPIGCTFAVSHNSAPVTIPLDAVRSVWRSDVWNIAIEGRWGKDGNYHRTSTIPGQP